VTPASVAGSEGGSGRFRRRRRLENHRHRFPGL